MKHAALSSILFLFAFSLLAQEIKVFTDSSDRIQYNYVTIGTQVWMAQNLKYKSNISCYYDDKVENKNKSGSLYIYSDAQSVCPLGWHLPSDKEWQTLIDYLGGSEIAGIKLKSKTGWSTSAKINTNESGFSAIPGGLRHDWNTPELDKLKFYGIGGIAGFWTSTPDGNGKAFARSMWYQEDNVRRESVEQTEYKSVRCIRNNQ